MISFDRLAYRYYQGLEIFKRNIQREIKAAKYPSIYTSREFLEIYRQKNQSILSVVGPVVNYYTRCKMIPINLNKQIRILYLRCRGPVFFDTIQFLHRLFFYKDCYLAVKGLA